MGRDAGAGLPQISEALGRPGMELHPGDEMALSLPVLQLWRAIQGWAGGCVTLKRGESKPSETGDLGFGDGTNTDRS